MNFRTAISQAVAGGKRFCLYTQKTQSTSSNGMLPIIEDTSLCEYDPDDDYIYPVNEDKHYDIYVGALQTSTSTSAGQVAIRNEGSGTSGHVIDISTTSSANRKATKTSVALNVQFNYLYTTSNANATLAYLLIVEH